MGKYKQFIMGLLIGSLTMFSVGVLASSDGPQKVVAWLTDNVEFIFDGEYRSVPEEYGGVIIYNDRTYLPTRFIAENIDAEVNWDDESRTVTIRSAPCSVCPELPIVEPKEPEEDVDKEDADKEEEDLGQPEGDYRKTPLTKYYDGMELTLTLVNLTNEYGIEYGMETSANQTRLHLRMENSENTPLQLQQSKTKAVVDGIEYTTAKVPAYRLDTKWYSDLRKDDVVEGYIALPLIPEDAKEMKVTIYILENDWRQTEREVEFDIALDLD